MHTPERIAEICASRGLTERQARFIVEYLTRVPRNATQAYRIAYEVKVERSNWVLTQAGKMMAHPKIRPVLDELRDEMLPAIVQRAIDITGIDEAYVVAGLARVVESPFERKMPDGRTAVGLVDAAAATKALELLGRRLGIWIDKKEVNHTVVPPEVQNWRDNARRKVYATLERMASGELIEQPAKAPITEPRVRPATAPGQPTLLNGPPPPESWPN